MSARRKVVLMTYYFPPAGAAGSLRMLAFTRHLPEFGWDPVVVTVGRMGVVFEDETLLARLDPGVRIHRWFMPLAGSWALRKKTAAAEIRPPGGAEETSVREAPGSRRAGDGTSSAKGGMPTLAADAGPARGHAGGEPISSLSPTRTPRPRLRSHVRHFIETMIALPDPAVGWSVASGIRAGNWMKAQGVSVFVTTSPPYSMLLAGFIARAISGAAWVCDLRDPWATFQAEPNGTLRDLVGRTLQSQTIRHADRVLANTPRFREALLSQPGADPGRIETLPNGYDAEEIAKARTDAAGKTANGAFTIVHAGGLYKGLRQPVEVLEAMSRAMKTGGVTRDIRLVLPGDSSYHHDPELKRRIESLGLEGKVEFPGYVPHEEVLALEASADLLLLIQGEAFRIQVPSKAYEYLAIGRPILAVTTEGATADVINSSPVGDVVAPGDIDGLTASLLRRLREAPRPGFTDPPPGVYSRRELTARLAGVLDAAALGRG